jgi:adenylate kinase
MKTGQLVPDMMMLRLIFNELSTRGWIKPEGPMMPYTLNSSAATEPNIPSSDDPFAIILPTFPSYSYSDSPTASFILDGFPRNVSQAQQIGNLIPINWVVHIDTPSEIVLDRISNRWVHAPSGRVYNTTFSPPKVPGTDDVTGEPLTRRDDDNLGVWKARLSNFEKASVPLLEHYHKEGVLWTVKGNTSDEISPKLFMEFERRFGT